MNQLVAPTSFMTSISRRRANIAMRIVFRISRPAAPSRNTATSSMPTVRLDESCWTRRIVSVADATCFTPGLVSYCWLRAVTVSTSLLTGTTPVRRRQDVGGNRVDHLGRVGEQPLELLVGGLLVDEGDLLDRRGCSAGRSPRSLSGRRSPSGLRNTTNSTPPCQRWRRVAHALAHHHRERRRGTARR